MVRIIYGGFVYVCIKRRDEIMGFCMWGLVTRLISRERLNFGRYSVIDIETNTLVWFE